MAETKGKLSKVNREGLRATGNLPALAFRFFDISLRQSITF